MADCVLHAQSAFPLGGIPPSMAVAAINGGFSPTPIAAMGRSYKIGGFIVCPNWGIFLSRK